MSTFYHEVPYSTVSTLQWSYAKPLFFFIVSTYSNFPGTVKKAAVQTCSLWLKIFSFEHGRTALVWFIFSWMQHTCKTQGKTCVNDTSEFTEPSNKNKNLIAIVWPFVCSSFADLCISFDGKNKEINARNVNSFAVFLGVCKLKWSI